MLGPDFCTIKIIFVKSWLPEKLFLKVFNYVLVYYLCIHMKSEKLCNFPELPPMQSMKMLTPTNSAKHQVTPM